MAYYAALASLVQLLDDIISGNRYPTFLLGKHRVVKSVREKFALLEESLQDYSSKGDEANNSVEGRIRDVAYQAQDLIEFQILNHVSSQARTGFEGRIRAQGNIEFVISNQIRLQESTSINRTRSEERMNVMKKNRSPILCFGCFKGKKFNKRSPMSCSGCFRGKKLNKMVEQETSSIVEEVQMVEQETSSIVEELQMVEQETSSIVEEVQMVEQENSSIVEELQMVEQEIDSILKEMMAIKERHTSEDSKLDLALEMKSITESQRSEGSELNTMGRFYEALNIIKDQLCGQPSQLHVIPIVGMGGIGKTTLARKAYDDDRVKHRFDRRVWVTISQDYHKNAVLQSIAKSLGLATGELHEGEERDLKVCIHQDLVGRRYLIVVDDIWGKEVWDDVRRIFPNNSDGSRIMLTTRIQDVATYANPRFVHEMQFLNEHESWNLLQKKVFEQECCLPELKNVGMQIASKCRGLPLAVVLIAGILSHSKTPDHWENIARKVLTMLSIAADKHLNTILSHSYNHLSHQLKACFLYLGSFPEDYEIKIRKLIRLWIAEGFLKSSDSSKLVEKVGEECVEDLVKRNLVLITKKRPNGQFKICILHDVVREFCRQRAFSECFFHEMDVEGRLYPVGIEKVRRINYYGDPHNRGMNYGYGCHMHNIGKLTRSFNFLTHLFSVNHDLFRQDDVKLLRVFNSPQSQIRGLPDAFFPHLFLKYLSFVTYDLRDPVFMLQNLQTLILRAEMSTQNFILPPEIWQMTQLRHLIIYRMTLPSVPVGVQKLECLQTLMIVEDCRFPDELIQMIPNLRKLKASSEIGKITDANCLMNLVNLPHLEELKIEVYRSTCSISFPLSLKELSLYNCDIRWKVMKMVGSLPNLQVLKLQMPSVRDTFPGYEVAEEGEEWEPIEGEFQRLKFLEFRHLKLKYWRADDTHFPRLEYLSIRNCEALEMIPKEIGDIPTLKVIHIFNSYAAHDSAYQIQENQRKNGNVELQVFVNGPPRGTYMELSHPRRPY